MTQAVICDQGVIDGGDVIAISWLEPEHGWDSGFAMFSHEPDRAGEGGLLCIDCLLDLPDIGTGLDLAKKHGVATRTPDGWVPDGTQP